MTVGSKVTLASSQGHIERIVVEDLGEIIRVCREEEFLQAKKEGREPVTVGFPKKDILN